MLFALRHAVHERQSLLEERFALYFNKLGASNTRAVADKYTTVIEIHKTPEDFGAEPLLDQDVEGLAD